MENLFHTIRSKMPSFSKTETKIAACLLEQPETVIHMTIASFAARAGVSEGSVINFSNALGFRGFSALKLAAAQSLSNQEQVLLSNAVKGDGPHAVMCHMADEISQSFQSTLRGIGEEPLRCAAELLLHKKRIEIYGVGSSSMLANDAYYRLMRQGFPAYAATDPHIASVSASFLDSDCAVIAISHTGRTIETLQPVKIAKEHGASVISITSYGDSPLTRLSDVVLVSSSRENREWKESLISRYSQLLILDTLLMYLSLKDIGHTFEYMENMTDIIGEHRILKESDHQ